MSSLAVSNASYTGLLERLNGIKEQVHASIVKEMGEPLATDEYRETFNDFLRGGEVTNSLKAGTDTAGVFSYPTASKKTRRRFNTHFKQLEEKNRKNNTESTETKKEIGK